MSEEIQEKPKHDDERASNPWLEDPKTRVTGAVVLIGLGVLFLLAQFDVLDLSGNWWAIFIAFPAIAMLYNAYTGYTRAGTITDEVRKNVAGGAMVATVAIIAFTGEWGRLWPLFLIVPGVLWLLGFTNRKEKTE